MKQKRIIATTMASTAHSDPKGTLINKKSVTFEPNITKGNELIKRYNKEFNTFNRVPSDSGLSEILSKRSSLGTRRSLVSPTSRSGRRHLNRSCHFSPVSKEEETVFFDYKGRGYEPQVYWFEYGGRTIAKFNFEIGRWKTVGQNNQTFPLHFSVLSIRRQDRLYLIGWQEQDNVLEFSGQTLKITKKDNMIKARNFFASVYLQNKIYVFGGYDDKDKRQIGQSECYDLETETWREIGNLNIERSQAAACCFDSEKIYIIGGYNSKLGTIGSIEEYSIKEERFTLVEIVLPEGLRRLSARNFQRDILVFGGVTQHFENNDVVYRVNIEGNRVEECGSLEKGGVVEWEVLVDSHDVYHLFLEECNGTAPPFHLQFQGQKYIRKDILD